MRLYPVYLALLVLFIVLQLIYGNRSFADINLEEYDMSKVEVMDTPFWCSATPEERQEAINNLTEEQRIVALENGTERPFFNEYWNSKDVGIYVDVISGPRKFAGVKAGDDDDDDCNDNAAAEDDDEDAYNDDAVNDVDDYDQW